ncbi:Synaptotagmin-like protein 5 [Melipona quadrifasciata]|uniref:Synaptotagmin-like protein 5 n=1 Tax=Melipona quadrifasciata TaxID=166423 RepID=A0A0M8ZQ56_9HYME|nr:Synaptotagmin-like protein 5 [Melipona quadrifasciata]
MTKSTGYAAFNAADRSRSLREVTRRVTSSLFFDCCTVVPCYPRSKRRTEEESSSERILAKDGLRGKNEQLEMKRMALPMLSRTSKRNDCSETKEFESDGESSLLDVFPKHVVKKSDEQKSSPLHSELFPKCRVRRTSQQRSCDNSSEDGINDGSSLSEACSTPIIGAGSRAGSSHTVIDVDDMDAGLHSGHLATRASLSSLGARSDSMASVYSGAGEGRCCRSVVVTGEVEFALQYDYKHLTFEVHVTKCKNLAPVDVKRKRSDPYVKVYLLPDKSKSGKRKTKVKKHTLNPEFNETLKFHMSLSGLETRTLWLTVWHSDMFGRNDFLGEVRMPLENKIFDDPTPKWYPLQERTEPFDDPVAYKGEVIVGLKFVPPDPTQQERDREVGVDRGASKSKKNWSRGSLHVLVKEARNLQTRAKNSGTCDPFCKSYLLPDKGRSGKQKTGVVRRSGGSPVWGHTFIYKDVSLQELAERGLELTVWDHDRIASNEFLGGVRFNLGTGKHYGKPVDWMDATGRELSLWQSMLERPNFWVEGAVTLRPNLHNHGKNSAP